MNAILGPRGTPMVELGGSRAWKQYIKGDIVVSLQWLDLGEQGSGDGPEPVMALFPANRRMDAGAFVLPAANAYLYVERSGMPTAFLFSRAFATAAQLGFHPDKSTVYRVMDAICECMADLLAMPTTQPGALHVEQAVSGIEATIKINGKTVAEEVF